MKKLKELKKIFKRKKTKDPFEIKDEIDDELINAFDDEPDTTEEQAEEIEKTFIYEIKNGCPLCSATVKGNNQFKYFCKDCNILFTKGDLNEDEFKQVDADDSDKKEKKQKKTTEKTFPVGENIVEDDTKKPETKIEEDDFEYDSDDDEDDIQEEPEEVIEEKEPEYELEEESKIIASTQSTKMHKGTCHFVKKINPENRQYLSNTKEGEKKGYNLCVCLRRLKYKEKNKEKK